MLRSRSERAVSSGGGHHRRIALSPPGPCAARTRMIGTTAASGTDASLTSTQVAMAVGMDRHARANGRPRSRVCSCTARGRASGPPRVPGSPLNLDPHPTFAEQREKVLRKMEAGPLKRLRRARIRWRIDDVAAQQRPAERGADVIGHRRPEVHPGPHLARGRPVVAGQDEAVRDLARERHVRTLPHGTSPPHGAPVGGLEPQSRNELLRRAWQPVRDAAVVALSQARRRPHGWKVILFPFCGRLLGEDLARPEDHLAPELARDVPDVGTPATVDEVQSTSVLDHLAADTSASFRSSSRSTRISRPFSFTKRTTSS